MKVASRLLLEFVFSGKSIYRYQNQINFGKHAFEVLLSTHNHRLKSSSRLQKQIIAIPES